MFDKKILSRKEEINLFKDYKENNNIESRNILIESNLRFVRYLSKKYSKNLQEDLFQEGVIGLIKSIEKYDYLNSNARFITFAYYDIKNSFLNYFKKNRNEISLNTKINSDSETEILDTISKNYFKDSLLEKTLSKEIKKRAKNLEDDEIIILDALLDNKNFHDIKDLKNWKIEKVKSKYSKLKRKLYSNLKDLEDYLI